MSRFRWFGPVVHRADFPERSSASDSKERRSALLRLVVGVNGILFSEALVAKARSCSTRPASLASKASYRSGRVASIEAKKPELAKDKEPRFP